MLRDSLTSQKPLTNAKKMKARSKFINVTKIVGQPDQLRTVFIRRIADSTAYVGSITD